MKKLNGLYVAGAIAALTIVLIIPIQIFVFIFWPPPETVVSFFELFQRNWFLGLLSLDLLYIFNNVFLVLVYLGIYAALRRHHPASALIALVLGFVGIACYYSSAVAFEMLSLSHQYAAVGSADLKLQYLAAGRVMLAHYKGTAFNVYYVLNAVALIVFAAAMLRDKVFSRATAVWGLFSGILMLIPTTAGKIGLILGIASLLPWTVFSVLVAVRLFRINRQS